MAAGSPQLSPVMTLPEYLKMGDIPDQERPIVEMFAKSSDIMEVLPFEGLSGGLFEGFRTASLPTLGFRGINEGSTSGSGTITPFQEATYIIDHDIPVDRALVDRGGERRRAMEEQAGVTAMGQLWINTFLKGDNTLNPRLFNGLQKRSQKFNRFIDNSNGQAGGSPLSLFKLDQAINNTNGATHIIAPWMSKPLWIQAARTQSLTGYVVQTWDETGKPKLSYGGYPILFGYPKDLHPPILPYTEVAVGGGAPVTSSLYVVGFGEMKLRGLQIAPMEVRDVGLLQDSITYNTHIHWDVGMVDEHLFCLTRLGGMTFAPIVP